MECPICNGLTQIKSGKEREVKFRKESFKVFETYYECENCGEKFVDTKMGDKNIEQVHNQYREKYNLLFPVEITELREKYGLTKTKMSLALGLGENTYANYEKGAIPNESHNFILDSIKDPKQFQKAIEKKKELFNKVEKEEIFKKIDKLLNKKIEIDWINCIWPKEIRSDTGFIKPDLGKFINMVLYFLKNENIFKTKLNKLLFYSDFYFYKENIKSISGSRYRASIYGPVPTDYDAIYNWLMKKNIIETKENYENNEVSEKLHAVAEFREDIFNESELKILKLVKNKFKNYTATEMKDYSHKEFAWKENEKDKNVINYQKYAFTLR
jgi:putative zinc finger/helix-turn-helix YgiT family protein